MSYWSDKKSGIGYPYFLARKSDSPASSRQAPAFDSGISLDSRLAVACLGLGTDSLSRVLAR